MKTLEFGQKTLIMGIVNCTPDSFYDGGKYNDADRAFSHAMQLLNDGADIIDIGGESSRPGADAVSEQEELDRVCPVAEKILKEKPETLISIDTVKPAVARELCRIGAQMINDISGLTYDGSMAQIAADTGAYLVLMHMRGTPRTMQFDTLYENLCGEIRVSLIAAAEKAQQAGVDSKKIILDPGIGFSKTTEQNYEIISRIPFFISAGYPVLIGLSRKSLIGKILADGEDRLPATIALNAISALKGADIVRVHDVKEHVLAMKSVDMLRRIGD